MHEMFLKAQPVLKKIEDHGFEACFVGGSVRDFLIGKNIHDVDIATSAKPEEIKQIFDKTIDVGIEHGTLIVLYHAQSFEVTTYRSEKEYEDHRRPSTVNFISSLEADLSRRDFTMNAIAMRANGELFDPFNGQADIKQKLIRTVGRAHHRFSEDALRMLRAVRFVSQLAFEVDGETKQALILNKELLRYISVERILMELDKLLLGDHVSNALRIVMETGIYQYIPTFNEAEDALSRTAQLDLSGLSLDERWAILLYFYSLTGADPDRILSELRMSNKRMKGISLIIKWMHYRMAKEWTRRAMYEAKESIIISVESIFSRIVGRIHHEEELQHILVNYEMLPIRSIKDLHVTGSDLLEWTRQAGGPWVKETLKRIEDGVLHNELVNDKDAIKKWVLSCSQN